MFVYYPSENMRIQIHRFYYLKIRVNNKMHTHTHRETQKTIISTVLQLCSLYVCVQCRAREEVSLMTNLIHCLALPPPPQSRGYIKPKSKCRDLLFYEHFARHVYLCVYTYCEARVISFLCMIQCVYVLYKYRC